MCYRFRIISEIRSHNEFSSRETKPPAIRMNTKMLNAFLLFSRKRNNEMSWNFHRLVLLHVSWFLYSIEAFKDTLLRVYNGFKRSLHGASANLTNAQQQNKIINPNSLDNKGSCWILKNFYCSVTMPRELGLK